MDEKNPNEMDSGLSKDEEKLIRGDLSNLNISESMPTEEIKVEKPSNRLSSADVPREAIRIEPVIKHDDIVKAYADYPIDSQRFRQTRVNGVFYVFLGMAAVFYTLSLWMIKIT